MNCDAQVRAKAYVENDLNRPGRRARRSERRHRTRLDLEQTGHIHWFAERKLSRIDDRGNRAEVRALIGGENDKPKAAVLVLQKKILGVRSCEGLVEDRTVLDREDRRMLEPFVGNAAMDGEPALIRS